MPQYFAEPIDRLIQHYETYQHYLELIASYWVLTDDPRQVGPLWQTVLNGPAKHWKDYRKHLTRIHQDGFDYDKFVGKVWDDAPSETFPRQRLLASQVASWMKSSRRIYRVPEDLELLLAATSLNDVNWENVRWPFDSFLITLEVPIILGGNEIDSILVCYELGEKSVSNATYILAVPRNMKKMDAVFIGDQSERISRALLNKDYDYASQKLNAILTNRLRSESPEMLILSKEAFRGDGLAAHFENEVWEDVGMQKILRIVFGMLLYLQSLPASITAPSGWKRSEAVKEPGHPKKITLASEVCNIASVYKLNLQEKAVFRNGLRGAHLEVSVHYREGHWRRPPGKGSDPNFPKTVWVRPTIVRFDKLEDGGLPGGSEEKL
jgi:hypothetical protein